MQLRNWVRWVRLSSTFLMLIGPLATPLSYAGAPSFQPAIPEYPHNVLKLYGITKHLPLSNVTLDDFCQTALDNLEMHTTKLSQLLTKIQSSSWSTGPSDLGSMADEALHHSQEVGGQSHLIWQYCTEPSDLTEACGRIRGLNSLLRNLIALEMNAILQFFQNDPWGASWNTSILMAIGESVQDDLSGAFASVCYGPKKNGG